MISRGNRCATHQLTEEQRGYGRDWRRIRQLVRRRVPACENCGSTYRLAVDHIVPQSMGGTNDPSNLRVLCARCHATIGLRSNANRG